MRSYLLPTALIAVMGISSAAFAATTTTGMVKAFDAKAMTLTLDDGTVYHLQKSFKDPGLKAGEKVSLVWDMKGKKHEASAVTIVK